MPTEDGAVGDTPQIAWPEGCAPEGLQVEVLVEGDGREVGDGAAVLANYAGYVWGEDTAFDSSYDRGAPSMFSLNSVVQGWTDGIPGATVGSRLLLSIPPDLGYGPNGGNPQAGIGPDDTIVFVLDVVDTHNADDAGEPDAPEVEPDGLPVAVDGGLGEPTGLTVNDDASEPAEPAVYPLSEGTGEPVALGQSVAVNYSVTFWDGAGIETSWSPPPDGEEIDSPMPGPMVAALGQGTIFDLLDGVTIGSRVVLVAPATEQGQAIAVVADVLGAA